MEKRLPFLLLFWLIFLILFQFFISKTISYRPDFAYTSITHYNQNVPLWAKHLIAPWANFDGVHYLTLAAHGYTDQARFLPLYPGILWFATQLLGDASIFSTKQLLISLTANLAIFLAMLLVWKKLLSCYLPKKNVMWTLAFFLVFSGSFFLLTIYTESLFLLLAGLSILLVKKGKWWWALLPAPLLTITRLTGFVIIPTLGLMLWQHKKNSKLTWLKLLSLSLAMAPLIGYAYFNYLKWGDWLYFVHAHGELGNSRATNGIVLPPVTLYRYYKILTTLSPQLHEFSVALIELVSFLGMTGMFIWSWIKKVPKEFMLFSVLALSIPVLSGTLTGFPRYTLAGLPLLIPLSYLNNTWKICLLITFGILQLLLLSWFATGYFVA